MFENRNKTEKKNIVGIIPARGGSKRLPLKNIKELAGKPLITYTIEEALKSKTLDRIIVSTDHDEIARISKEWGAEVPFKRPAHLALDTTHAPPIIRHTVKYLEETEDYVVDIVVILPPTSPLRKSEHIEEAIKKILKTDVDSVMSVCEAVFPPWWMVKLKENGLLEPFIKSEIDYFCLESQELPKVYQPNGAIYVTKSDVLFEQGVIIGKRNAPIFMDDESSLDIDTLTDFKLAELIMEGREKYEKDKIR